MSDWNGFGSLDLSSVEAGGGSTRLQPGTYAVKCTDAKVEAIGSTANKKLVADFADKAGTGDIRMTFNIVHSNSQAQEIGMRQLKSFLVAGDHPNPDKPGDVGSLKNLECKIIVGMGKPWINRDNVEVTTSEIKKFMALDEYAASAASSKKAPAKDLDDEIPF
jgi:hypothetical protein